MGWWNLENLFDEEHSLDRTDKVRRAVGQSIVGWTPEVRDRKISQLASVIVQMNGGAGPDLLGVCEVETAPCSTCWSRKSTPACLDRLYQVVHADTSDARGIDVAFLYDPSVFEARPDQRSFTS